MPDYHVLLKAFELACEWIANDHQGSAESFQECFKKMAEGALC